MISFHPTIIIIVIIIGRSYGRVSESDLQKVWGVRDKTGVLLLHRFRLRPQGKPVDPVCKGIRFFFKKAAIADPGEFLQPVHFFLLRRQGEELLAHLHGRIQKGTRYTMIDRLEEETKNEKKKNTSKHQCESYWVHTTILPWRFLH